MTTGCPFFFNLPLLPIFEMEVPFFHWHGHEPPVVRSDRGANAALYLSKRSTCL